MREFNSIEEASEYGLKLAFKNLDMWVIWVYDSADQMVWLWERGQPFR